MARNRRKQEPDSREQQTRLVEWTWRKYREAKASGRADLVRERTGDLVRLYLPWVTGIARRLIEQWVRHPDLVDTLVQDGSIGLLQAIAKYDPDRGVKFRTYALPRVRGAMQDGLRAMDHLHRSHRAQIRAGTAPPVGLQSLNHRLDGGSGRPVVLAALLPARPAQPGADMESSEFWWEATRGLNSVERLVVFGSLREGLQLKRIGRYLGLSESRVSQIRSQAVERIRQRHTAEELERLIPDLN